MGCSWPLLVRCWASGAPRGRPKCSPSAFFTIKCEIHEMPLKLMKNTSFCRSWDALGMLLAGLGPHSGTLGVPLAALWLLLARSWPLLGRVWGALAHSGATLTAPGALHGASWAALGALLGRSWPLLGPSWLLLGRSWNDMQKSFQIRHPKRPIWTPQGLPKGGQIGAKIDPKTNQNRRQKSMRKKTIFKIVLRLSWGDLGTFCGRSWAHFY